MPWPKVSFFIHFVLVFSFYFCPVGQASSKLSEKLTKLRVDVIEVEKNLIESLRTQKQAQSNLQKIQVLIRLQREEQDVGRRRMQELEKTISELESRRLGLKNRMKIKYRNLRQSLSDLERSLQERPVDIEPKLRELVEGPRRVVLANLVEMQLKEIEAIKVDLADADSLENRIDEEKQQLSYLFQEVKEHEGLLEVNRQLQAEILQQKHQERIAQLETYRKLKNAESQVEQMITQFNARMELQEAVETERNINRNVIAAQPNKGESGTINLFAAMKGKLVLPVQGKVVSEFGRVFDTKTNLYIFKKGVDIESGKNQPVSAVCAGKVAFSGELPNYGRLTIVDHGNHFYTLIGHLGELIKRTGDWVAQGEKIGLTDDSGTPVYFEIRSRNIAVNPLQWISN